MGRKISDKDALHFSIYSQSLELLLTSANFSSSRRPGQRLAPLSVSSRNLWHAAALNFITPPHETEDDSNTRRTGSRRGGLDRAVGLREQQPREDGVAARPKAAPPPPLQVLPEVAVA